VFERFTAKLREVLRTVLTHNSCLPYKESPNIMMVNNT
jgi:hypothetical protein